MISALEIAAAVNKDLPESARRTPTPEQISVIEAPLAPTLVVAGAGSGKTATMADRVVWLVVNGYAKPDEILGLTFTRKAAGELAERVRHNLNQARRAGLFEADALEPATATYNSFAAGVVRDHALRIGRDPDAQLLTDAGASQLMKEVVAGWRGPVESTAAPSTLTERALQLAEELRSHLVSVVEARSANTEFRSLLAELSGKESDIAAALGAAKERAVLLDFVEEAFARMRAGGFTQYADQVATACEIAERMPAVGKLMRQQFKVVLLDEFQDTSVAQLQFLVDLFGAGYPVMAVGDPNQAIYGWRGASASSLVLFSERFATKQAPTAQRHLTISWRNDSKILEAANHISKPLEADTSGAGALLRGLKQRERAADGAVHQSVSLTESDEAREVARWVAERWEPGKSTAAVLSAKRAPFAALVREFRALGIEPEVVGLKGLLSTPEIIDLRSALEVASDPGRGDSMMRLLTNERLGVADLHVLSEWSKELAGDHARGDAETAAAIVEAVTTPPPAGWRTKSDRGLSIAGRSRVQKLDRQLRSIRAALDYPLSDLVTAAERALMLDIEVSARPGISPAAGRAKLDAFAAHAVSYSSGPSRPTLSDFLAWLDEADSKEDGLESPATTVSSESVQIMTVHAAKGLEWDVVAVAGLTEGTFPKRTNNGGKLATKEAGWVSSSQMLPGHLRGDAAYLPVFRDTANTSAEFAADVAAFEAELYEHAMLERRRLAYVAFTRARHELLLSGSHFRSGKNPLPISRVLTEVAEAGLAATPTGFAVVPPPGPQDPPPELPTLDAPKYPGAAPAGAARQALALKVQGLLESADLAPGDFAGAERRLDSLAATASGKDLDLVEDVRLMLRELAAKNEGVAVALPARSSASAAVFRDSNPQEYALELRRPLPKRPSDAARIGTAFHAWVENYFGMQSALEIGDDDEAPDDALELAALKAAFERSVWAGRRPIHVELPLEVKIAGQVVSCKLDAVFADGPVHVIVDWKTGSQPTDAEVLDNRRIQLELYRIAYSRAHEIPLEQVRASFHYVAANVSVESGMWTAAQIEERLVRTAW